MSSRPSHLETRYKHDLTPRQEQVMRMITAGRTNAEIAAALDISLDGAKYHVREILSKVGAESREEAVEIWRSGHRGPWRRLGSALAGLIPSSGVGRVVAGGGAVTVTAVAITWVGLSQQGSPAAMLPPCDPWALALSLQPTSGAAGASYALEVGNPGQPCHVYERVGFEVLGPTGSLLSGLNNNGPTTNVDARLDRSLTVGTWTWDQWCGRDGPFTARALLGAATSPAVAVAAPPCATVSVPPSVTFDDGRPARVDVADCRAYSQVCDMAEVAAGWAAKGDVQSLAESIGEVEAVECSDPARAVARHLTARMDGMVSGRFPCEPLRMDDRGETLLVQRVLTSQQLEDTLRPLLRPDLALWRVQCSGGGEGQSCRVFEVVFVDEDGYEALTLAFLREFGALPRLKGLGMSMPAFPVRAFVAPNGGSYFENGEWTHVPRIP